MPTEFEIGRLVGLLIGEAYFGGDGKQATITLKMHVRHEPIFRWLITTFPASRLYGPYHYDDRHFYQWMARGQFLRTELIPILDQALSPEFDRHSFDRYQQMKINYRL